MSLQSRQHALDIIGKGDERSSGSLSQSGPVVFVTNDDLTMDIDDLVVRATVSTTGQKTITLPSVAEAAGRFYSIAGVSVATGTLVVQDKGDDAAFSDESITSGLFTLWYSDGYKWFLITTATA